MTTADATQIVDEAHAATASLPCFDSKDRFVALLEHVNQTNPELDDDTQAAVIAACREKAGLECRPAIN
jgi:hypothetical protein